MRTTDNFNLDLYEGTDIFNPLITENGNMEKIDEQMQKNFDGSIGVATELKNGTVHALTRADETPVFRFVATSNYDTGDTFTVDGLQVSGLLADGRPLSQGAYVINANVLCCLTGTVLTFYITTGTVDTAENSLKLGGELPAYYGTAEDVQDAKNVAQASSVLVNQLNTNLSTNYYTKAQIDVTTLQYSSQTYDSGFTLHRFGKLRVLMPPNPAYTKDLYSITLAEGDRPAVTVLVPNKYGFNDGVVYIESDGRIIPKYQANYAGSYIDVPTNSSNSGTHAPIYWVAG